MITRGLIRAEQAVRQFSKRGQKIITRALLGNSAGAFDVPNRESYIYARLMREGGTQLVQAQNPISIQRVRDLPVLLEVTPQGYKLIGVDSGDYIDNPLSNTVGSHADQHIIAPKGAGGFDGVPIFNAALHNLRCRAQVTPNMTVYVEAGPYIIGATWAYWAGGSSGTLVAPTTPDAARVDLVYLGNDAALHILQGTPVIFPSEPTPPTVPAACVPLGLVTLGEGDTSIVQAMIDEPRVTAMGTLPDTVVNTARRVDTTAPLAGGGELDTDLTLSIPRASAIQDGYLSADDWNAFNQGGGDFSLPHLHGLARWVADGAVTAFDLPDIAEAIDWVSDAGLAMDPLIYELSSDRAQIVFDTAPTAGHVVVANYQVEVA